MTAGELAERAWRCYARLATEAWAAGGDAEAIALFERARAMQYVAHHAMILAARQAQAEEAMSAG